MAGCEEKDVEDQREGSRPVSQYGRRRTRNGEDTWPGRPVACTPLHL